VCGLKGWWLFVADGDSVQQRSPSQVSVEDDGSTDSFLASDDINDAYSLARDKNLISRALETVAKVSTLLRIETCFMFCYSWPIREGRSSVSICVTQLAVHCTNI
jgi:hypothetical protein